MDLTVKETPKKRKTAYLKELAEHSKDLVATFKETSEKRLKIMEKIVDKL